MHRSNCSQENLTVISGNSSKINLSPKRQINETLEHMDNQSSITKVKKPLNYYDMMPKSPNNVSIASAMGDLDVSRRPHS